MLFGDKTDGITDLSPNIVIPERGNTGDLLGILIQLVSRDAGMNAFKYCIYIIICSIMFDMSGCKCVIYDSVSKPRTGRMVCT